MESGTEFLIIRICSSQDSSFQRAHQPAKRIEGCVHTYGTILILRIFGLSLSIGYIITFIFDMMAMLCDMVSDWNFRL